MKDLTYTAQGYFNDNCEMDVTICVPPEPSSETYERDLYNLSKKTSDGVINAVFCFFNDGSEAAIKHERFDYRLNFRIDEIKSYKEAVNFEEDAAETLFLFFHNHKLEIHDLDKCFNELEKIYEEVKELGNHNRDYSSKSALRPRKIGMSIVLKNKKN